MRGGMNTGSGRHDEVGVVAGRASTRARLPAGQWEGGRSSPTSSSNGSAAENGVVR
jgi:hypothetical protein